ncbi:MAG: 50S ribosomal protein L18 [Clostridia bacterium]|nr:50S ribosomal protein L18 [Christensenellaceae bacterium]MBQ4601343.1 50S ribosomal protein L18 [Clostridia bacterium]
MIKLIDRNEIRQKRHQRIRNKVNGTAERPRLAVYRSSRHIYAQIIDDVAGNTLAAASTVEKDIAEAVKDMDKSAAAKYVGETAAKRAIEKGVSEVVFDRGGYLYTGRVACVADGAREAGLKL